MPRELRSRSAGAVAGEGMARRSDETGRHSERAAARAGESEWAHEISEDVPAAPTATAAAVLGAEADPASGPPAVILDDGDLDDVVALVSEMTPEPVRILAKDLDQIDRLPQASRAFLTTARLAMELRLPPSGGPPECVAIAVAEDESQTVTASLRRLGFDYVVRRPVHPEALRLLLLQALFRGNDKRVGDRAALGCEVTWRIGWKRGRGIASEISSRGCRLLAREAVEMGSRISLRIPERAAGGKSLTLRGRVFRRDPGTSRLGADGASLAVLFEGLSAKTQGRLDELVLELSHGPVALEREAGERPPRPPEPPREGRVITLSGDVEHEPAAPEEPPGVRPGQRAPFSPIERRREPRGVLNREVVALDAQAHRVTHTLLGSDLSRSGMRVEPHPALSVGERLRVGLYDATSPDPLIVEASVARDDGERGLVLLFDRTDAAIRAALERVVAALPAVQSLGGERESERVFLSEILLTEEMDSE